MERNLHTYTCTYMFLEVVHKFGQVVLVLFAVSLQEALNQLIAGPTHNTLLSGKGDECKQSAGIRGLLDLIYKSFACI